MRFIKNLGPRSHIGFLELELNSLNMLNVDFKVKQFPLSHVHKLFNGTGTSYLSEHFIKVSDVHHHLTRGSTENLSPPVKYFTDRSKAVLLLWIFYVFFCPAFAMSMCASVYMCFVVTCWERADILAIVCGV